MAEVIADPEKLRQFASVLTNAAQQFEQSSRQLQRGLDSTGFKGSEGARFESELRTTLGLVSKAAEKLKAHAADLQRKVSALERFSS